MYNLIFFTNILRFLDERGMTKQELSEKAEISISFLSDLTNGKANPSLKIMESIATALEVPLPTLLESTDMDHQSLQQLSGGNPIKTLPNGLEQVVAVLPAHQAFIVRKWAEAAKTRKARKK